MPIEIRELVIKATIAPEPGSAGRATSSRGNSNETPAEEIIKTCVEKVLEILKERNGR